MRLGSLQDMCKKILADMDGVLGIALVDLPTGLPLALESRDEEVLGATTLERLAATGVSYFKSSVGTSTVDDEDDEVEDVQTTSDDTYLFMSRMPGPPSQALLVLVVDRESTSLGLGWMNMRQALEYTRTLNADPAGGDAPPNFQPTPPPSVSADQGFPNRSHTRRSIRG